MTSRQTDPASQDRAGRSAQDERLRAPQNLEPELKLHEVADASLCVTKGKLERSRVIAPTFRAVAPGQGGDAAEIKMIVRESAEKRALASGQLRRQVGIKLRAADACNVVYVMWRLDPRPMLEVSTKINPGFRNTSECGSSGYTKVKGSFAGDLPELLDGKPHTLRAEIVGESLVAWVDDAVAWAGALPDDVRTLQGPSGLRSDNLEIEILGLATDERAGDSKIAVSCETQHSD